jgi:hypothetical protein
MSDTRTMTLTDFLLARIAEDEEVARGASAYPWQAAWVADPDGAVWAANMARPDRCNEGHDVNVPNFCDDTPVTEGIDTDFTPIEAAAHIASHDPARVLTECEAKRRIVEACAEVLAYDAEALPQDVLRCLALPYADHPDYREEWKP